MPWMIMSPGMMMQRDFGRFQGRIGFELPFRRTEGEWRFFYRDFFTMFLRWTKPIVLIDGSSSRASRLMRRKVNKTWQYRALSDRETRYLDAVENGTHC